MISLCKDNNVLTAAISEVNASSCIEGHILLYLGAYGTGYDFLQFYIQKESAEDSVTAIIMLYNTYFYVSASKFADLDELSDFLYCGDDIEIISNVRLNENSLQINGEICAVMSRIGTDNNKRRPEVSMLYDSKIAAELVMCDESKEKYMDFYLNTSHLIRHNAIRMCCYSIEGKPVSLITIADTDDRVTIIPTVYTHKDFRGNGYCKLLTESCLDEQGREYQLLCEQKNIVFYKKCGFEVIDEWFHYQM